MGIVSRYARATQSSNLKDDELHHNTEPLAAVALCGETGLNDIAHLLWRVKYSNDATSYAELRRRWIVIVNEKSQHRHWPSHIVASTVAALSLDHFINDVCPGCSGKGHLPIFGAPILSPDPCTVCKGQGIKPVSCEKRLYDYVVDMVESLAAIQQHAAGRAMRKLADEINF